MSSAEKNILQVRNNTRLNIKTVPDFDSGTVFLAL